MAIRTARFSLFFAVLSALVAHQADAQEKGVLGVGVIVGEPTGVTAKYFLADDTALAAALGFAPLGDGLHGHLDFHWHPIVIETGRTFALPLYVGAGARFLARGENGGTPAHLRFGARGVAGIMFDFTEVPIDVFAEFAGILDLRTEGDALGFAINAALGVRYYF